MIGDTRSVAALPRLELFGSPQLTAWLAEHQLSIAFSTYNTGKLFLIGIQLMISWMVMRILSGLQQRDTLVTDDLNGQATDAD